MTGEFDLKRCFEFAKRVTLQAGEVVKRGFDGDKLVSTKLNEIDLVTNFDNEVEDIIVKAFATEYPDHKFIAEESASAGKVPIELTDAPTWLLDPIDGTTNFVHSFPLTAISLALAVRKEVLIGIVYNPITSELYTAIKGEGAYLNGKPIRASSVTELKKALITLEPTMLRFATKNRDIALGRFEAFVGVAHGIRSIGSAAIALVYVARGAIDGFHMDTLQPWDVAAGMLIAREAGGAVIDSKGGIYDFMKPHTIAASNETLAKEMSKLIVDTDLKTQRKRLQRS